MGWTNAQQKVIDTRNKNVLVSAAAGSGKTAVLVERIISMISEGENPLDIDHLLVVTFTNAAAAEMRGRIGKAIDEKLTKNPDNLHLQKQISLLQSAQITTIHSFCLNVIRNYFHRIDLDPSFKIAEESEITLMKSDVISELLERWYEEGREDFHDFIESYSYSKSDAPIEELIKKLYSFAMSDPWPKRWIARKKNMFDIVSVEEMSRAPWMRELINYIDAVLEDLLTKQEEAAAVCSEPGGPLAYLPAITSDRDLLLRLKSAGTYEEYLKGFAGISFERLSAKKNVGVEDWKKERVKEIREEVKKGMKDLAAQFFFQSPEEMVKDLQAVGSSMKVLFELTLDFMEAFAKKKEEKNLIDFNDFEHFALKILVDEQEGEAVPTQAAIELSEQFEEILIDEYQDSNMVQETILKSISREPKGSPNRFMVGDVKQSIYKFRLAMPELFMEKYGRYSCEDKTEKEQLNLYQRIDLDKNFRSRFTVLDYVNKIFQQIMKPCVGGIIYDEPASLKYGELFEETLINKEKQNDAAYVITEEMKERIASETEILLITEEDFLPNQNNDEENSGDKLCIEEDINVSATKRTVTEEDTEEAEYTKKELEARLIARKIKELTDPVRGMLVFDRKENTHRPAVYRDIVILLRSMANWSEVFVNTLMQEGISAYAETGTGYFQTLEIRTILNVLRVIDNPRQDIPLVGTLYSPMVYLSSTELSMIRAFARNVSMYTALLLYRDEGTDEAIKDKVCRFLNTLEHFRDMVNYKPIHELIQAVLDHTGYYHYISTLPAGDRRKANLDMLISQAVRFEKGSYSGLFHFIRYIEKLNKYEVDYGEAATAGEQDNTVRIMSIHKSKGLEFPVVFVAGMSKQFNTQDIRSNIILHNELGIGPEYVDYRQRTKIPTLIKKVMQKKVQIENMGEELRVLYVAMTRAKEKLILTGYLKSIEEVKKKAFSFFEILSAKSFLELVLPATINITDWEPQEKNKSLICRKDSMSVAVFSKCEMLKHEMTKQAFLLKDKEELLSINPDCVYDENLKEELYHRLQYEYPYQREAGLKIKMTVSELKKLGQFQDEELSANLYQNKEVQENDNRTEQPENSYIPNFISKNKEAISGTDRGTLYHKVLELIDLSHINEATDVRRELDRLVQENRITDADLNLLKLEYIYNFVQSDAARRMKHAEHSGKLYKEKQFVFGMKASEVLPDYDSSELVLIQGIVDVFFEEDNELVLLDYKSDLGVDEQQLRKRYRLQLDYYRKALEQMQCKKVKEMIIYSLPLAKEIRIVD